MAYRFKRSEDLAHAIQRVFTEEVSWAVGQLEHSKKRMEAVHEARKSLKKIRGLLSLVAAQLGSLYKREDRYFREAGRKLSRLRDNAVMLQTFDELAAKHPEMNTDLLTHVRQNLLRSERETQDEKEVSAEVLRLLRGAKSWPVGEPNFEVLLPALTNTYRAGRKALKKAQKEETVDGYHDVRKKVKQHYYHLRLFESTGGSHLKARMGRVHHVESWLGDDHNLSVLREYLEAGAETRNDRNQIRELIAIIDYESNALRKRAIQLATELYAEKPAAFSQRLVSLWTPARKAPLNAAVSRAAVA